MSKAKEFLVDWVEKYFNNRNLMLHSIEKIEKNKNNVDIYMTLNRGKLHLVLVEPYLTKVDSLLKKLLPFKTNKLSLFILNTKENFEIILANWDKLAKFDSLFNIYFMNPFSKLDKKWTIYPMTHNSMTDKKSLKPGLQSLAANVDWISKEEYEKIIK